MCVYLGGLREVMLAGEGAAASSLMPVAEGLRVGLSLPRSAGFAGDLAGWPALFAGGRDWWIFRCGSHHTRLSSCPHPLQSGLSHWQILAM